MRTTSVLPPDGTFVIHDLGALGFPEVPYFAGQNTPKTQPAPLPPHMHKDLMEICYFFTGERIYEVDGEVYRMRANQVFVTWPNEMHGSGGRPHGKAGKYWMQVRLPEPGGSFLGSAGAHADALVRALWNLPRRSFPGDRRMAGLLAETMRLCREPESAPLTANRVAANLLQFLLKIVELAGDDARAPLSADIAAAVRWIERHPDKHPHINELAERAHLSASRFKNKFVEQVGLSPGDFILRNKIKVAKPLLRAGRKSVTEIAMELGFSSHQHFSGTFSRYMGCPPSAYAARSSDTRAPSSTSDKLLPRYIGEFCHGYFKI